MIDFRPLSPKATSIESSRNVEIYQKSTFRLHTFECNVSWESNKQADEDKNCRFTIFTRGLWRTSLDQRRQRKWRPFPIPNIIIYKKQNPSKSLVHTGNFDKNFAS